MTDPIVRLRRLLGEQWSPQWTGADAVNRACDEIERLRLRPEAALIAAVHDMLAALEMIQAQVSKHALRRHSGDFLDDPATVAAFSAMRAALKKARGERGPQPHEQEGK